MAPSAHTSNMDDSTREGTPALPTLFLGAGVSLPLPAGAPLFGEVRTACAVRAGLRVDRWSDNDKRRRLLEYVVPEVFLKTLNDSGVDLARPLARAVSAGPHQAPNAVHIAVARVLAHGGTVWTTNWDDFIERAYRDLTGESLHASVPPGALHQLRAGGYFGKLHGDARRPETLRFRSSQVIRALPAPWNEAVAASAVGRDVLIAGYGGADVDLYGLLNSLLANADRALWLEGVGPGRWEDSALAAHEIWRFCLRPATLQLDALPGAGRHLLWCGGAADSDGPSAALLAILGVGGDVSSIPTQNQRYQVVLEQVRGAPRVGTPSHRLLAKAVLAERLGQRGTAAVAHLGVVAVGDFQAKGRAVRSLGNLVGLRGRVLRRAAAAARSVTTRGEVGKLSAVVLSGGLRQPDPDLVSKVLADPEFASVDEVLSLAGALRWQGRLAYAVQMSRAQVVRVLEHDLDTPQRDWPEPVCPRRLRARDRAGVAGPISGGRRCVPHVLPPGLWGEMDGMGIRGACVRVHGVRR